MIIKNNCCGIYKITSPSGSVYIGQSMNIRKRVVSYRNLFCKKQPRLYNSIVKYGWEQHLFEILEECDFSHLDKLEIYYIDLYQSFNTEKGLNLRGGGGNGKISEEQKKKMSEANKGRVISESTRNKLRLANLGKKHTPETILKMSKFQKGRTFSPEAREKLRISNTGKIQNNKASKINLDIANRIRELYKKGGYTQLQLANMYNLSESNTCRIIGNHLWKNGI